MAGVALNHVTKRFGKVVAVDNLSLEVADHEFLVLLGPSGCGKSTTLRMIAGLEDPTEGDIVIDGKVVNDREPKDHDIAMVFQSYALYPHMTVRRNIEFPLRSRKTSPADHDRLVTGAAETLGLEELLDRKPAQLSGGQRQRVALARAIVRDPKVFLMDEPLSNLDAKLRVQTRAELVELQRRLDATVIYVTHDQTEAMTMGHRIAIMRDGVLQQLAAPQEVYERPVNRFVAEFIGNPPMNMIPGGLVGRGDGVAVGVRPEHLEFGGRLLVEATVIAVESLGHERHIGCRLADDSLVIVRQGTEETQPAVDSRVELSAEPRHLHAFDVTTGERVDS